MGLKVGGQHDRPDWPKMGPSLLIATSLIVAVRTAKWPQRADTMLSEQSLNEEIEFAVQVLCRDTNRYFLNAKNHGIGRPVKIRRNNPAMVNSGVTLPECLGKTLDIRLASNRPKGAKRWKSTSKRRSLENFVKTGRFIPTVPDALQPLQTRRRLPR
jgi:hypothetical protein